MKNMLFFMMLLLITFIAYGLYEFQYVMHLDNSEHIKVFESSWHTSLYETFVLNLVIASIIITFLFPFLYFSIPVSKRNFKFLILVACSLLFCLFIVGVTGSIQGRNELEEIEGIR